MNKKWLLIILILPLIIACSATSDDWQELDLGSFQKSIPKQWNYEKERGDDSFVGRIVGPKLSLSFDYSSQGYANDLIPSAQEYIKEEEWMEGCYFCEEGVIYTEKSNVKNVKIAEMRKRNVTDSSLVKVEAYPDQESKKYIHEPTAKQKLKYPKADYIADLTYKGKTVIVPIELPDEIKRHHTKVDTTDLYIIKTVWPKIPSNGVTGIYIKSRTSHLNFQLSGDSLPKHEQDLALKAFKTIKLKSK